jgi:diguanylate cyclase (GGDEF)-like protein
MSSVESAAARVIPPLSALLQKPLCLVDGQSPEASGAFAIRFASPRMCVVSADGRPFSDPERQVLSTFFDVVRLSDESEMRFQELEQRMLSLQRENLDLVVKNRVLSEVSSRDTLTGLFNRGYVIEKLDSEINRAVRHGSPMALLMIDIDHFKNINDTFGHGVGDQVLQWVGKTLRDSCRVYDVPARYGGEEFCVVLPETRVGNTTVVAERIRYRLETSQLTFGDSNVHVTASFGIAGLDSLPGEESLLSPAALIDRADRALYSAKNRGRNRVELWDDVLAAGADDISH